MTSPASMADAIRSAILYSLGNVHTAMPGAIISYDFTNQKASVQPLLNKLWSDGTNTSFPVLNSVPVIFPKAGGASLTFPVVSGDTCLLLFCERSIDSWLQTGGQVDQNDVRKFDLSDAIAIMGLSPFSETSQAQNNTDVLLTYAGSSIRIQPTGEIDIKTTSKVAIGTATTEVLSVLSQILAFLSSATAFTAPPNGPLPFNFSVAAAALKTQVDAIKGSII